MATEKQIQRTLNRLVSKYIAQSAKEYVFGDIFCSLVILKIFSPSEKVRIFKEAVIRTNGSRVLDVFLAEHSDLVNLFSE